MRPFIILLLLICLLSVSSGESVDASSKNTKITQAIQLVQESYGASLFGNKVETVKIEGGIAVLINDLEAYWVKGDKVFAANGSAKARSQRYGHNLTYAKSETKIFGAVSYGSIRKKLDNPSSVQTQPKKTIKIKRSQKNFIVTRFSEKKRRRIFNEFIKAQDRATKEAESKYPTEMNNIPLNKWSSYDFDTAISKNSELGNKLRVKYEKEGLKKNWPLPKY